MLMPKKVKNDNRKMHRGRMSGPATQGNTIAFGEFGLVAAEPSWITSRQIEAARIAMTRHIKRGGKVWIRIFPDRSYTKKPLETRMGKGKAPVEGWVAVVKTGRVMFEMAGVEVDVAKQAMRLAMFKLPIKCKFIVRPHDAERDDRWKTVQMKFEEPPIGGVAEETAPVTADESSEVTK